MVSGLGYRGHGAHCELRICAPAVEEVDHLVRVRARVRVRVRLRLRVRVRALRMAWSMLKYL